MPNPTDSYRVESRCEERVSRLEAMQRFLEHHLSPEVLAVFPEWQGFLLVCPEPVASVWVVRTQQDGERLHRVTGIPALLLEDVLAQRARPLAEVWQTLLSCLIVSNGNGKKGR